MICTKRPEGWELVYQRAHALLAAQLLAPWRADERPGRWTETLAATAQHDDGWREWEPDGRLSDIGTPLHFREAPLDVVAEQSRHVAAQAWHQGLWIGLLISRHLSTLHTPLRGQHDDIDAFLDAQTAQRRAWREQLGVKQAEVIESYAFLAWADALSLLLCERRLPYDNRAVEITEAPPGGTRYDARLLEGSPQDDTNTLTIEPWPYDADQFTVRLDTYRLDRLTFDSHADLLDALAESTVAERVWTVQKS